MSPRIFGYVASARLAPEFAASWRRPARRSGRPSFIAVDVGVAALADLGLQLRRRRRAAPAAAAGRRSAGISSHVVLADDRGAEQQRPVADRSCSSRSRSSRVMTATCGGALNASKRPVWRPVGEFGRRRRDRVEPGALPDLRAASDRPPTGTASASSGRRASPPASWRRSAPSRRRPSSAPRSPWPQDAGLEARAHLLEDVVDLVVVVERHRDAEGVDVLSISARPTDVSTAGVAACRGSSCAPRPGRRPPCRRGRG